jgi:hypothetical protein
MTHAAWAAVSAHGATAHEVALHETAERATLRDRASQHETVEAHSPGKPHHHIHNYSLAPDKGAYADDRVKHWQVCSDSFQSNPSVEAGCSRPIKAPVDPVTGMPAG